MLEKLLDMVSKSFNEDSVADEVVSRVLNEAKTIADERGTELTDAIVDEVADKMMSAGEFLQKLNAPLDAEWKLNSIVDSEFCAKCGTCEIVCPNNFIAFDEKPFLAEECRRDGNGMCHEVCPRVSSGRYQISIREDFFEEYYYAKGDSEGQDGGVVTDYLKYLIDSNKIDGAIVVGDSKWKPISLVIKDSDALKHAAKSKYSISPLSALKKAGELGLKKVAVVGLPCQIEGLRKLQYHSFLAKHEKELGDAGLPPKLPEIEYLIGLFCTEKFELATIKDLLAEKDISIRDVTKFDVSNGKFIIETGEKTLELPVKDIELASGCKVCRDFASDLADVSVGSVGSPEGYSTVVIRTNKGADIKDAFELNEDVDIKSIEKLENFKLKRFRKTIEDKFNNEDFISYYWNDYTGGIGLRADGNYFIRVRGKPSGWYEFEETKFVNDLAHDYGARIKLTNRGAFEIHDVRPIDVEEIVGKLIDHDLLTGSEGPLVRATLACPGADNCALGLVNTTDLCYELEEKFCEFPTNYKFKIAINGCPNKCSRPQIHDFGINGIKYPITDEEKCNGCGRCADVCKVDALDIRGEMSYSDYSLCIGCGKCINACPHDAKEVKFEGYELHIGGKGGREIVEGVRLEVSSVDEIVDLIEKVIKTYNKLSIKPQKERLAGTMKRIGQAKFIEEVKKI